MMIGVMLLLVAGGIGLSQAVSDPHAVTLRWLRLGAINALGLLAVAISIDLVAGESWRWIGIEGVCAGLFAVQLLTVQKALRRTQRLTAALAYLGCVAAAAMLLAGLSGTALTPGSENPHPFWQRLVTTGSTAASAGLLGGFLMTMLLGHAYLTSGNEMTQKPFHRLVVTLLILWLVRMALGGLGLWELNGNDHFSAHAFDRAWRLMMITARWVLGFIAPGVFLYMALDCVRRRANQSATGILYVATVMVVLGEGIALALWGATGQMV